LRPQQTHNHACPATPQQNQHFLSTLFSSHLELLVRDKLDRVKGQVAQQEGAVAGVEAAQPFARHDRAHLFFCVSDDGGDDGV
jgi:hypothetical protein